MPIVRELGFYLGKWPSLQGIRRPSILPLPDRPQILRQIHQDLLTTSANYDRFRATIRVPEMRAVDLTWSWAGQTGGVVVWTRQEKAVAISLYIACECPEARDAMLAAAVACHLELPPELWNAVETAERPIIISAYFGMGHYLDPLLITACHDFGYAFFTMFGTNDDEAMHP